MATRAAALVYLLYVVGAIRQNSHGAAAVLGYAGLVAFAAGWLVILHAIFVPLVRALLLGARDAVLM